jgi:hypothetical protein
MALTRWRQGAPQAIFERKNGMKWLIFIGVSLKIGACGALKLTSWGCE